MFCEAEGQVLDKKSDTYHLMLLILPAFSAERKHRAQGRQLRTKIITSEYLLSFPTPCSIDHACALYNSQLNFLKIPSLSSSAGISHLTLLSEPKKGVMIHNLESLQAWARAVFLALKAKCLIEMSHLSLSKVLIWTQII